MAPQPALDRQSLLERLGGDRHLARDLIDTFLAESGAMLFRIRAAVRAGDAAAVQRAAHTARGALLSISADGAAALAERLEAGGRDADLDTCRRLIYPFESELARAERELQEFRAGL